MDKEIPSFSLIYNYIPQRYNHPSLLKGVIFMGKPACNLIGENGNIFNLMGIAGRALNENGLSDQAEEMGNRIMGGEAGSYDEAIRIIKEYVEIE